MNRSDRSSTRPHARPWSLAVALLAASLAALLVPGLARANAFVPADLLARAGEYPSERFDVIVIGSVSTGAGVIRNEKMKDQNGAPFGSIRREYQVVDGVAAELTGGQLLALARRDGIASITPDAPVVPTSTSTSTELWPVATGVDRLLEGVRDPATGALSPAPPAPTIAIVDSGVEPGRLADFGGRLVASLDVTATGRTTEGTGDAYGHGTLVAGLAAGASARYPGAAPNANIVSLRVVDANGAARTSDVIAAADWIYRNRAQHGIRVANFSLRTANANYGLLDPLNRAVRRLWLTGTVVVTAAGNDGPGRMLYAPASDPFVITVGAVDLNGTASVEDDTNAPWSSYGYTAEGFAKPELGAPGRYLAGPVPAGSTLATALPDRVVAPGYMWMSGSSFSAAITSGVAAQILARNPGFTPDQVKGALMLTARPLPSAAPLSVGVGQIAADAAAAVVDPPDPHANLKPFVRVAGASPPVFDAAAWNAVVRADASWTSASWTSASWTSASWTSASWTSASWTSASWTSSAHADASWTSASWTSASWTSASWTSASWTSASWTSASWTSASWTSGGGIE